MAKSIEHGAESIVPDVMFKDVLQGLGDIGIRTTKVAQAEDESCAKIIGFPSEFEALARNYGINKSSVQKRLWTAAEDTIASMLAYHARVSGSPLPKHEVFAIHAGATYDIDLYELLEAFREVEAGEIPAGQSLGKTGWDLFADTINTRIGGDPNAQVVLPFDGEVHPYLFTESDDPARVSRASEAVLLLEARYQANELF